jgi:hypothetical protein
MTKMSIFNLEHQPEPVQGIYLGKSDELFTEINLTTSQSYSIIGTPLYDDDEPANEIGSCDIYLYRIGSFVACRVQNFTFTTVNATTNYVSTSTIIPTDFKAFDLSVTDLGNSWVEKDGDASITRSPEVLADSTDSDGSSLKWQILRGQYFEDATTYTFGSTITEYKLQWLFTEDFE